MLDHQKELLEAPQIKFLRLLQETDLVLADLVDCLHKHLTKKVRQNWHLVWIVTIQLKMEQLKVYAISQDLERVAMTIDQINKK